MRAFGVALIVLGLMLADFSANAGWVQMSAHDAHGWAVVDTFGLIYAGWWFWRDGRDP